MHCTVFHPTWVPRPPVFHTSASTPLIAHPPQGHVLVCPIEVHRCPSTRTLLRLHEPSSISCSLVSACLSSPLTKGYISDRSIITVGLFNIYLVYTHPWIGATVRIRIAPCNVWSAVLHAWSYLPPLGSNSEGCTTSKVVQVSP
jgi:hypothetical protein